MCTKRPLINYHYHQKILRCFLFLTEAKAKNKEKKSGYMYVDMYRYIDKLKEKKERNGLNEEGNEARWVGMKSRLFETNHVYTSKSSHTHTHSPSMITKNQRQAKDQKTKNQKTRKQATKISTQAEQTEETEGMEIVNRKGPRVYMNKVSW